MEEMQLKGEAWKSVAPPLQNIQRNKFTIYTNTKQLLYHVIIIIIIIVVVVVVVVIILNVSLKIFQTSNYFDENEDCTYWTKNDTYFHAE